MSPFGVIFQLLSKQPLLVYHKITRYVIVRSMHWQDTENPMVLPHAEPDDPTPEEDDGGEQRQKNTDEAKEIADALIGSFKEIFKDEKVEWPNTGFHRSRWW